MTIAPADDEAVLVLASIHETAFETAWSADDIGALLAGSGVFALMASEAGSPVAFLIARIAADESEILTLAVRPDSRRSGLARALMTAALARVRAEGARFMILEVAEDNDAAMSLYTALGFSVIGRRPAYYGVAGRGGDARVLRCEL